MMGTVTVNHRHNVATVPWTATPVCVPVEPSAARRTILARTGPEGLLPGEPSLARGLLADTPVGPSPDAGDAGPHRGDERWRGGERWIRFVDVSVSLAALLFFLPLMITIAAAVWLSDKGPVLFRHRRVGAGGRHFYCLKFRSMCTDADARLRHVLETDAEARAEWQATHKLQRDPRITTLGRFLRKSSLDELPQLINVLRGDMSLVGPRPIVDAEVPRYGRHFAAYCAVRPGVTGLWQVARRDDTSYRRRVACDLYYRRSRSLRFNLQIMVLTVPSVLLARGAF